MENVEKQIVRIIENNVEKQIVRIIENNVEKQIVRIIENNSSELTVDSGGWYEPRRTIELSKRQVQKLINELQVALENVC
jgi:hypothetical protein